MSVRPRALRPCDVALLAAYIAADGDAALRALDAGARPQAVFESERPDPAEFVSFLARHAPEEAARAAACMDRASLRVGLSRAAPAVLGIVGKAVPRAALARAALDAFPDEGRARAIAELGCEREFALLALEERDEAAFKLAGSLLFGGAPTDAAPAGRSEPVRAAAAALARAAVEARDERACRAAAEVLWVDGL